MTKRRVKTKFSADDYNRLVSNATSKVVYIQERRNHWFMWIGERGDGGQGLIHGMRFYETGEEAAEVAQKTELPVVKLLVLKTRSEL